MAWDQGESGLLGDRRQDEADEFWDLSKLLPPKKKTPMQQQTVLSVPKLVEVPGQAPEESKGRLSFSDQGEKTAVTVETYTPAWHSLITSVTVERKDVNFSFYSGFRRDALRLQQEKGAPHVPYVPFFSYVPQYSQLNSLQLAYYLSWREDFRAGRYGRLDEAYFRLYVYEILNLFDEIPPAQGLSCLCRLWREYRKSLPQVDKYMAQWIVDYCLLYKLPCPTEELHTFFDGVMKSTDFPEFFLAEGTTFSDEGVELLLSLLTGKSKHRYACRERYEALFDTHIRGAMGCVLRYLFDRCAPVDRARSVRRTLTAFSGSICAHNLKARMTVTYHPCAALEGMKNAVTCALKYTENKLRAMLSVRNRLRAEWADEEVRHALCRVIDDYFAVHVPLLTKEGKAKEPLPPPAYERLYDAPAVGVDWEAAAAIESQSWDTTRRLTAETEEAPPEQVLLPEELPPCPTETDLPIDGRAWKYLTTFLDKGASAASAAAHEGGVTEEYCIERINEAFFALYGDVLFLPTAGGYEPADDYMTEVLTWIQAVKASASPSGS